MSSAHDSYRPSSVSPPGDTLEEMLQERSMSAADLAERIDRPERLVRGILSGSGELGHDIAASLESVFGVPATFWNRREARYRAFRARSGQAEDFEARAEG